MSATWILIVILSVTAATLAVNVEQPEHDGAFCNRECVTGDARICYFKFTLEFYQSMGVACGRCAMGVRADCEHPQCIIGDGVDKGVMSINRKIPGPPIHVCQGDVIVVDVVNQAPGSAAAIHWHGLHMRQTPWMDGVPFVTQCPIAGGNTFRYYMNASEPGTQFYHSHSGHHKINGQYGALIVRQPVERERNAYDQDMPEHHILISDWMHSYGEMYFPGLSSASGILPDSILINGRGAYIDPNTGQRPSVPPTVYNVEPNTRYRFRVINSVSHICPTQLQIEEHALSVIASDSYDVSPQMYDTLVTNSGERFDFILETNQEPRDYWIRVRGLGMCSYKPMEALAVLRYGGGAAIADDDDLPEMPSYYEPYPMGKTLNYPNATCQNPDGNAHCVTELQALDEDPTLFHAPVDHKFFLAYHNYPVDPAEIFKPGTYNHFANLRGNVVVVGAINNISLVFPPSPPLTQPEDFDDSHICHDLTRPARCDNHQLCPCVHILHVKTGSIVELVVVDESTDVGPLHHPFHLHGHRFVVTAMGQDEEGRPMTAALARKIDNMRGLRRTLSTQRPIFKDTISIPSRGYSVLRLRADNPGYWLMHCHYEWHLAIGMGLILQVGEPSEMVPPPANFPTCGNYQEQDIF